MNCRIEALLLVCACQLPSVVLAQTFDSDVDPTLGPDFVVTPAGSVHKDCVIEVADDETLHATKEFVAVLKNGVEQKRLGQCAHPMKRARSHANPSSSSGPIPTIVGWIEFSIQGAPANAWGMQWYNKMTGSWNVPPTPAANGPTVFLFNSLEPADGLSVIQPVLQYGVSGAGGGFSYGIASWFVNLNTGTVGHSLLRSTTSGHAIQGSMTSASCTTGGDCTWTIKTADVTASVATTLTVWTEGEVFDTAEPGVLEIGGTPAPPLSACNQLPNVSFTLFQNTFIYEPGPSVTSLNDVTLSQVITPVVFGGTPNCPPPPGAGYQAGASGRNTALYY